MTSLNLLRLPQVAKKSVSTVSALSGSSMAFAVAQLATQTTGPVLCLTADTPSALGLEREIAFLLHDHDLDVLLFPDWETLPYDHFSPHQDIISQRLETLYRLPHLKKGVIIMPVATSMQRVTPLNYLLQHSLLVEKGQRISLGALRDTLAQTGYTSVTQVMEHGEFAARGSILDIFPMGSEKPFRLDFFDDEVDSIRSFDPEDQRSLAELDQIRCLPAREFPTDQAGIEQFRQNYRALFQRTGSSQSIYGQISKNQLFAGIEYYLPLFFAETASLFDYLSPDTYCVRVGELGDACNAFWESVVKRYDDRAHDIERPILEPRALFVAPDEFFATLKNYPQCKLQAQILGNHHDTSVHPLPDLSAEYQKSQPLSKLSQLLENNADCQVLFTVPSAGRREVLFDLLKKISLQPPKYASLCAFLESKEPVGVLMSPLEQGFSSPSAKFFLIAESDLLGERVQRTRRERKSEQNPETVIRNLAELSIGQAVTHLDHGIGLYQGLEMITSAGVASEYLKLTYFNDATLYVPVTSLHKISRYMGSEHVVLSRLGSDRWNQAKRKAAEKVHDIAAELLTLYAQREAKTGDACTFDETLYQQFSGEFPFEETPDQEAAIDAVVADMRTERCMDRLVCGDVGFGKTEVAMRAAFIAVQAKKQVAILVPTTLLAQQHYESFRDRFANWPVQIELLSRFRTGKESSQAIEKLKSGHVDIVIGTHKLLGKEIQFNNLGLLIIDEEHRFGVKQKEKIKSLRAHVDILALTATPIPRTLNMSVHGLRDLSIIATPPAKRLSIKTFVHQYQDLMASEAILRELKRGGQVYYLHNDVSSIHQRKEQLQQLIPQASIDVAHGQMRERELEQVMSHFYHQRFQVLVCTTIIETGIDIPTANTIIIDRADKLGLSQLHQLRGRVGRSHHQAYAYLFTPPPKLISTDARKRLDAISSLEDLGAGFTLATHDLEIRGTGEILGEEQSGQMQSVGFSLYMDMLQQAVKDLKAGKTPDLDQLMQSQTDIELRLPALLPDTYMPNVNMRLSFYKRLGNISNPDDIIQIKIELVDRFGSLPSETQNLLTMTQLRIRAEALGIKRIEGHARGGSIEFSPSTRVDPTLLVMLITQHPEKYALDGGTKLVYRAVQDTAEKRLAQVDTLLAELEQQPAPPCEKPKSKAALQKH